MSKLLTSVILIAALLASVRTVAQEVTVHAVTSETVSSVSETPSMDADEDVNKNGNDVQPQAEKKCIPFSELPLAEKIKRIVALTVFCIVLALYWLRNTIGAWVGGKPTWVRFMWGTLCALGRYVVRPILIVIKWLILLPLVLFCKMFKMGGKAAWITAKLTGKAALTVAKEVRVTGGVFGDSGGGSSNSCSNGRDAIREAERERRKEAEKLDKTPVSAIVQNNGNVIAKNHVGKVLFGVRPNGQNATAYCSDGCVIVNSIAGNGTRYVQIWDNTGKMIRTEAQPK